MAHQNFRYVALVENKFIKLMIVQRYIRAVDSFQYALRTTMPELTLYAVKFLI